MLEGDYRRLALNRCRQAGKSTVIAVLALVALRYLVARLDQGRLARRRPEVPPPTAEEMLGLAPSNVVKLRRPSLSDEAIWRPII